MENIKIAIAGNSTIDIKKATEIGMKSNVIQSSSYAIPIAKKK
jgi:hypothetical protein